MLDYFHRPPVAEHGVLLCRRTFPFVPFGDYLQAGGFGRGHAAHDFIGAIVSTPVAYFTNYFTE